MRTPSGLLEEEGPVNYEPCLSFDRLSTIDEVLYLESRYSTYLLYCFLLLTGRPIEDLLCRVTSPTLLIHLLRTVATVGDINIAVEVMGKSRGDLRRIIVSLDLASPRTILC